MSAYDWAAADPTADTQRAPQAATLSLEEQAALLVLAERELKRATDQRDKLRAELLERMDKGRVPKVELPEALVSYVGPSSSSSTDTAALEQKVEALGARLRSLGEHDVDDTIPTKTVKRSACLRITARLAPA